MRFVIVFLVGFYIIQYNKSAGRLMKMIYEKDLSEHCRRKAVPSVFLGRKVVGANARILQFSRLELPYSCNIAVRSEAGNSMVMMIQVMSREVKAACDANEQLLVYEMGETFGGYWGPLPDSVLRRQPLPPRVYTLKTQPTTSSTEEESEEKEPSTSESTTSLPEAPTSEYIDVVVPLVNLSVHMEAADDGNGTDPGLDEEEDLDLQDDVTPIPGEKYNTEILPLVQIQVVDEGRREAAGDAGSDTLPRFDLEFGVQDFTPDIRLIFPPVKSTKRRSSKQRYTTSRRVNFKKHRTLFLSPVQNRRVISETKNRIQFTTKYVFPTTRKSTTEQKVTNSKQTQDSWQIVADLLKKLSKGTVHSMETTPPLKKPALLNNVVDMDHSKSLYLSPNLSSYENNDYFKIKEKATTENVSSWNPMHLLLNTKTNDLSTEMIERKLNSTTEKFTTMAQGGFPFKETSKNNIITTEIQATEANAMGQLLTDISVSSTAVFHSTSDNTSKNTKRKEDITTIITDTETVDITEAAVFNLTSANATFLSSHTVPIINKMTPGSMVGHESWENVVQAAPVMAVLLNTSVDITGGKSTDDVTKDITVTEATNKNILMKRKKRDIHSIAIEDSRPHNLTTKKDVVTTTKLTYNVGHMQEFAQLAELQDDEMHGRVALRYLHQYLGPPLFNLCEVVEPNKPHVFLFNSSRIVISLTNFSFHLYCLFLVERMVVILTAARALRSTEVRCPRTRLECQVAGARVCMDAMVACDGVPNCGSYDIYDEDRLLCGHADSLQKNVYLAAFTFLAVLLTIAYAVHYWLKRCVPKVADAFFVYSDGVENILYLDSIMRSPHDMADPKLAYQSHMFGDDMYDDDLAPHGHLTRCQRFLRAICSCCHRTVQRKPQEKSTDTPIVPKKMYSFTELEIRKMLTASKETGVQTGDSLLMNLGQNAREKLALSPSPPVLRQTATSYDFTPALDNMKKDSLLTLEEPFPEQYKDELTLIKFFKESRSDVIAAAAKQQKPETKSHKSVDTSIGSMSEEIELHVYDRLLSEPGPSRLKKVEKERVDKDRDRINAEKEKSPPGSIGKHLRFDVVPIAIPPADDNDGVQERRHHEGRRGIFGMERNRRTSRVLDPIEEGDEHTGSKDHRHFWRTKPKKPKKGQVSLR